MRSEPRALANLVEAVLGGSAGILPDPVLRIAMALENIHRHFVAELAAEIDEQRDGGKGKQRDVPCFMNIHAGLVEALDSLLDAPASLFDKGFTFRVDCGEIDQVTLGIRGIPGSDGLRYLCDRNSDGLARDAGFQLHDSRFVVRPKAGDVADADFMRFLEFLKHGNRGLVGMIVNQLMALWAKQHQIADIIDVGRSQRRFAARSFFAEGNNMGHLREIARRERQRVLKKVFIAAVEFATAAGAHKQKEPRQVPNPTADANYRRGCSGLRIAGVPRHERLLLLNHASQFYHRSVQCKRTVRTVAKKKLEEKLPGFSRV